MTETIELIYIGEKFYNESASVMSSVYRKGENKMERWDWGFISIALEQGKIVKIRPATPAELKWANDALFSVNEKFDKMKREGLIS